MCPNAWLRTCSNHPCSHIYHSDTKQNIKHQMPLELSQIFLIFEQSKLLRASGNWNDLWVFRVAKLLTIVHMKTKQSTLSCITILILTKKIFFSKKGFFLLLFSSLYLDITLSGGGVERKITTCFGSFFLKLFLVRVSGETESTQSYVRNISFLVWAEHCPLSPGWSNRHLQPLQLPGEIVVPTICGFRPGKKNKLIKEPMETHSSVLAWRIPGMGEPGRLLSMGLHRVGHDWSDLAAAAGNSYSIMEAPEPCYPFFSCCGCVHMAVKRLSLMFMPMEKITR